MSQMSCRQLVVSFLAILALLFNAFAKSSSIRGSMSIETEVIRKEGVQGNKPPAESDRGRLLAEIESLKSDLSKKEAEFLKPTPEDAAKFASFLAQPDTGLIRLNPREVYDGKLTIRGGGAYYSFLSFTQEYGSSDIELERGGFSVGFAGGDWGFMCPLPETTIESATLTSRGIKFPAEFKVPELNDEIGKWQTSFHWGSFQNGFYYKRTVPAVVDTTYVLRSIHPRTGEVLVVFRPVRKDTDGSMIILWKILKRFPAPPLLQKVTLYPVPPRKAGEKPDESRSYFDFLSGALKQGAMSRWDLGYGATLSNEDWFVLSTSKGTRTVIKDLGQLRWTDSFEVQALTSLPKLSEGEKRKITIDTSGDTGDVWAKTTNIMAKVGVGHIYLMHIKDDSSDFYVLFRVEEFKQQSFCTITWKRIPTPEK